jgi:hypothetical protein
LADTFSGHEEISWDPKLDFRIYKNPALAFNLLLINLSSGLFPLGFPTTILYALPTHPCCMRVPSHPPSFDTADNVYIRSALQVYSFSER